MDEKLYQQYLNIINQLLTCNEGDEPGILEENQELLDQGLIEVMIAVAQQLEQTGKDNEAQFLINVAQNSTQAFGLLEDKNMVKKNISPNSFDFLMETLQKIAENSDPKVIYPFLAQNLDKLDDNFIQILDIWGT